MIRVKLEKGFGAPVFEFAAGETDKLQDFVNMAMMYADGSIDVRTEKVNEDQCCGNCDTCRDDLKKAQDDF